MNLNFKEALAALSRALPLVLLRAGVYVAGGFMVIVLFAMLLIAARLANGVTPAQVTIMALLLMGGGWVTGLVLERFFLFRYHAALLFLFSSPPGTAPGLAAALCEAARFFPGPALWAALEAGLRRFLAMMHRDQENSLRPPRRAGRRSACWRRRRSLRQSWPWPSAAAMAIRGWRSAKGWRSVSATARRAGRWRGVGSGFR